VSRAPWAAIRTPRVGKRLDRQPLDRHDDTCVITRVSSRSRDRGKGTLGNRALSETGQSPRQGTFGYPRSPSESRHRRRWLRSRESVRVAGGRNGRRVRRIAGKSFPWWKGPALERARVRSNGPEAANGATSTTGPPRPRDAPHGRRDRRVVGSGGSGEPRLATVTASGRGGGERGGPQCRAS
jgi:hypothetical protein